MSPLLSRRRLLALGASALSAGSGAARSQTRALKARPSAFSATPSARQLAWHRLETYAFLHFGVNTFTGREWGLGDEDPRVFDPTDFDADQIISVLAESGMRQVILTCKHHDGFCLWPSAYTEHSVRNSPFRNGKGDVVAEIAAAAARHGLKFGVYLSPWDRNRADYGQTSYVEYYINQLRELMTGYGPICEVWFDGANGGDGYYGGARETRRIDAATYYQWDRIRATVRLLQPMAVMFANSQMDIRWIGNENGIAGDPCWPTVDSSPYTPQIGAHGVRGGDIWNPAETDVSIRPGWFWHADEEQKTRSVEDLLELYLQSVGRGSNLLLNVPPDRRGRIDAINTDHLSRFHARLHRTFANNLAGGATARASSVFSPHYAAAKLLSEGGAWAAREDDRDGAWLQLDLPRSRRFDLIRLRECLPFGVRIDDFEIDIKDARGWRTIASHVCIGSQRLIRLDAPVEAQSVRLRILRAAASPVLTEFGLYRLSSSCDPL